MYIHGSFINKLGQTVTVEMVTKGDRSRELEIGTEEAGLWFAAEDAVVIEAETNDTFDVMLRRSCAVRLLSRGFVPDFFCANCREAGVMADPSGLRMSVSENLAMFSDLSYLGRIMDAASIEPVMSLRAIQPDREPDMASLQEAGMESAMESMGSEDPLSVPVYCDPQWNWNMFMAVDGTVEWMVMDDEGELHHKAFADAADVQLRVPDQEGAAVLRDYIRTLNSRDSFMGSVFSLMDENGYEDDMSNSYYGCLSVSIMDLLWRMSLLDHFMGTGCGAEGMREAIIFYDMDRLDAPTIGAFV